MKGKRVPAGTRRISANGYDYTKTSEGWKLTHHIVAEEKYNRTVDSDVTVRFVDGDRTNLDPDNIVLKEKYGGKTEQRKTVLKRRIAELKAELDALEFSER